MSEAPAPEDDAAPAAPDNGEQGAANLEPDPPDDPPTLVPPPCEDGPPSVPPPSAETDVRVETAEVYADDLDLDDEGAEVDEDELEEDASPTNGVNADDVAAELSGAHPIPTPPDEDVFGGPVSSRGPGEADFAAARGKPAATEHPPAGNGSSHSLAAHSSHVRIHTQWGIPEEAFADWDEELSKNAGNLLVHSKWVEDEGRARSTMEVLLPLLNPKLFPPDGDWKNLKDEQLRSKFVAELRKKDLGYAKYLTASYTAYMAKKREGGRSVKSS